jgi:pimeloyl-ACP methyl ester carboxylesterase
VASRHDRIFPLPFQRRIARERLGLEVDEIDAGHMLALSKPAILADRLDSYWLGLV